MTLREFWTRTMIAAQRHRVKIFDAGLIAVCLAFATLVAFEIDIFMHEDEAAERLKTLELNEAMILSTLLAVGALIYTMRRAREHKRDNERRAAAEDEVMRLALQDTLTGLPNRRRFDAALTAALRTAPSAPDAHAVFIMDLNGFKKINDLHGHPAGDTVLAHVGARLLGAVRGDCMVARLGGDEFAVLARNAGGAEGATTIARRIIDAIAPPVTVGAAQHSVGAAIGIALAPQDGLEPAELIRKADVALYRAKAEKKTAMRFFEPAMDMRLQERDMLERALRVAVESDAIAVRFLPSARPGGAIAAFEAIPVWSDTALGPVPPERFLAIAEESGLLARLTEQTLRKACAAAVAWPPHVRLAFNLPGGLLGDTTFGLTVMSVVGRSGVPPGRIDMEVDEGALVRDAEAAQALLSPLRRAGIAVIADHFGTGYSNLQNLNMLELDGVKIDRSFVQAMSTDRRAAVMVKALVGIGQGLDLAVVADGVCDESQLLALAAQGVDQTQGALVGGPVGAEEALAMVRPDTLRPGAGRRVTA